MTRADLLEALEAIEYLATRRHHRRSQTTAALRADFTAIRRILDRYLCSLCRCQPHRGGNQPGAYLCQSCYELDDE